MYRVFDPELRDAIGALQTAGVAVTWDNDDDITKLPRESPSYREIGGLRGHQDFNWQQRAMRQADLVTTTSRALAERYSEVGADRVRVVENYLPSEFLSGHRKRRSGVVVGWLAAKEHLVDAQRLRIAAVLGNVLDAHPTVRAVTIGFKLALDHERYERRPNVPIKDLANAMRTFDIGLAPLADIPFNQCRSTVKLKEYAAAGTPWLASPVGEYGALGPRQGGRLVADEEWEEAIGRLITSRIDRVLLARSGRHWARRQTIERNVQEWERIFEEAIDRARARTHKWGAGMREGRAQRAHSETKGTTA